MAAQSKGTLAPEAEQEVDPSPHSAEPEGVLSQRRRMRARWLVHLALLAAFVASLATVVLVPAGTLHVVVGLVFVALVGLHVLQRRHTVARLVAHLGRARTWLTRRGRLAWSDAVFALLTVNVLISGTYDFVTGEKVQLRPRQVGIPFRDVGWHASAAILLLGYLIVHVARRWGRLRRSVVR
jgi:hypothetical protein